MVLINLVGLFMLGKFGFVLMGVVVVLESYKLGDKVLMMEKVIDVGLVVIKVVSFKVVFVYVVDYNWSLVGSVVGFGVVFCMFGVVFNCLIYFDNLIGYYSFLLGVVCIFEFLMNMSVLVSNVVFVFMVSGVMGKFGFMLLGVVGENKMFFMIVIVGIFGVLMVVGDEVVC